MDAYDDLSAANDAVVAADRRLTDYYAKHGLEDGGAYLPNSDELQQIVADKKAAQEAQAAIIARL